MAFQSDAIELIAARLPDRYAIERELGRGGMATVYLAHDLRHGRRVALKFLRPELSSILGADRFAREIAIVAQLSHPHILPLLDSGALDGGLRPVLYYAMPYVDGGSLRERLRVEPQLPIPEAVAVARQVAEALDHAHRQGIVHRDIKPENILLSDGQAVVADFGIARAVELAGGEKLTETGLAIGTPAYMSPEQASATTRLDGRSDLYSLGCVLYEMLAGQPPFTGPTAQAILARHAVDPVPPLRSVRPTVARALERTIERVLAKVPADRYATAAEFARALEEALTRPLEVETVVTPVRRVFQRRRVIVGVAAVLAIALGGTAALRLRRPAPIYVPDRVLAVPLERQTGDTALDALTLQLASTLPDAIAREGVAQPVPAATVRDLLARTKGAPGDVAERLARETGAGLQLRGVCSRVAATAATCQVDLLRMPAKALRMSVSVTGDPAQPAFAAQLTERILVTLLLQKSLGDRVSWQGEYIPQSLAAVRSQLQGYDTGESKYFDEAFRLDTAWVDVGVVAAITAWGSKLISDAGAESTLTRLASRPNLLGGQREAALYQLAALRGNPELAFEMARRRFAVNPEDWIHPATLFAMATGRPNAALAISAFADSAYVTDPATHVGPYSNRGDALHQLGRYREELQLAREMRRRSPNFAVLSRRTEAMALAGLGEVDTLRRLLTEWEATPEGAGFAGTRAFTAGQELMAHGHEAAGREVLEAALTFYRRHREPEGPSWTEVWLLIWLGRLEEARRVALAPLPTVKSMADSLDFVGALGSIAGRQGRRAEAARYDRMMADAGKRPFLAEKAAFYRAQVASSLNDREGAVRLLEEARARFRYGEGLSSYTSVHRWPSLANLRGYPPFERFLRPRD
jgi:tRNA A-37 threonylcarbamoyl transferase component Bud32/tetratricopeptide (TPR) repeat protein